MSIGCVFYTHNLSISYSKGLYYSVLVGYNIGWNFEENYHPSTKYYSIFHMIVGVCAVTILLEEYIQNILNSDTQWYQEVIRREKYDSSTDVIERLTNGCILHKYTIIPSIVWVGVLIMGSIMAYIHTEWNLADSFFFTISTLFAGGFAVVPEEFSNFQYFCGEMLNFLYALTMFFLTHYCYNCSLYVLSEYLCSNWCSPHNLLLQFHCGIIRF